MKFPIYKIRFPFGAGPIFRGYGFIRWFFLQGTKRFALQKIAHPVTWPLTCFRAWRLIVRLWKTLNLGNQRTSDLSAEFGLLGCWVVGCGAPIQFRCWIDGTRLDLWIILSFCDFFVFLASLCALFGMVKTWPFQKVKWPPTFGDQKVTAWITWAMKKTLVGWVI